MIYVNGRFLSQNITGVQRFALSQLVILSKSHDVYVLVPRNADVSLIPIGIKHKIIGRFTGHLWEQFDLAWYLLQKSCSSILYTFSGLPPLLYKNNIFTIHDVSFRFNPDWFRLSYRLWYNLAYKIAIPRAKKVLTVSEYSKLEIQRYYTVSDNKISIVYNSIPERKDRIKNQLNKSDGFRYILLVSSVEPRKNISRFIDAFLELKDNDYKLLVVGGGGNVFKQAAKKINHSKVMFLGYVDDEKLAELYTNADAFAYPSLYEGFGIPPLEAMSFGCPCIVSNVSSIPEVCGDAAIYFNPLDVESIKRALLTILECSEEKNIIIKRGFKRLIEIKNNPYSILSVINESTTSK
ncbi:TPA: glycosyltransferase family 4 protein [Vibrio vulnificus]